MSCPKAGPAMRQAVGELSRIMLGTQHSVGGWVLLQHMPGWWITPTFLCVKVKEAKVTEVQINVARENYRPAAERASLLYFILSDLNKINPIYQFSLKVEELVWTGRTGFGGISEIRCFSIYAANKTPSRPGTELLPWLFLRHSMESLRKPFSAQPLMTTSSKG